MNISGPISSHTFLYKGRNIVMYSDRHNSTNGGCGDCDKFMLEDLQYQIELGKDNCEELPVYLHRLFSKKPKLSFYFEHPYVYEDPHRNITKKSQEKLDYIDKISSIMYNSLLRNKEKSIYLPEVQIHYTDIRDCYDRNRKLINCNPLSGSWLVKQLNKGIEQRITNLICKQKLDTLIEESVDSIRFILDNAWNILNLFIQPNYDANLYKLLRLCKNVNLRVLDKWKERLLNTQNITSNYNGIKVHRVCKQLLKLKNTNNIKKWCFAKYEKELVNSWKLFHEWQNYIKSGDITSESYSFHQESPIMIVVPLSSVIMDVYTLARMEYQTLRRGKESILFFCGAAHIDNYIDYFLSSGGMLINETYPPSQDQMRCLKTR